MCEKSLEMSLVGKTAKRFHFVGSFVVWQVPDWALNCVVQDEEKFGRAGHCSHCLGSASQSTVCSPTHSQALWSSLHITLMWTNCADSRLCVVCTVQATSRGYL